MKTYKIPFIRPCYQRFYVAHKKQIEAAEKRCHRAGDYTLRGDVWQLERNIAAFVGTKYCATTGSGTDALFLSLLALGVKQDDEVITCSNTFIASIQSIIHTGATPILIDVNEDEQMNVDQLEAAITPKTRVIMPISYTGMMPDMPRIIAIARKRGIHIVNDDCQALGASLNGKMAGTWGVLNCFSFNTAKLLGGKGDGGCVTTDSEVLFKEICLLRNHYNVHQLSVDRNDYPQPTVMKWAWKSRLDNVNAAFINVKFKTLKKILKRREEIALSYLGALNSYQIAGKLKLPHIQKGRVWQEFHLRILGGKREAFAAHMAKLGVETLTRDVVPNHKMPGLGLDHYNLPVTEMLAREVTRLPLHEWLTDKEVNYVIKCVQQFYGPR